MALTSPSFIAPPSARVGSSQWSATGIPKVRAYSSAVRMRWALTTGLPSSLTATAPAPTISPNSASFPPRWPTDTAPIGYTRAALARWPWRRTNPTAAWLSVTGSVFGIAQTAVNPPAAAARAPVAMVSTSSRPGSRRWQWTSMNPGETTSPVQSTTSAAAAALSARRGPISTTRPSSMSTSATVSSD